MTITRDKKPKSILTNHADWFNEALRTNRKELLRHLNSGGEYRVDDTPYIGSNRNTPLALVINNIQMEMLMNSSDIKASIMDHAKLIKTLLERGEDANLPSSIDTHGKPVGWRLILPLLNSIPHHPLSNAYPDITLKLCAPLMDAGLDLTLPMVTGKKNRSLMDCLVNNFKLHAMNELFRFDVPLEIKRKVISQPIMVSTYNSRINMSPIGALVRRHQAHTVRGELFSGAIKGMVSWGASLSDETEDFTGRTTVEEAIRIMCPEILPEIIALEASVAGMQGDVVDDNASRRRKPLL